MHQIKWNHNDTWCSELLWTHFNAFACPPLIEKRTERKPRPKKVDMWQTCIWATSRVLYWPTELIKRAMESSRLIYLLNSKRSRKWFNFAKSEDSKIWINLGGKDQLAIQKHPSDSILYCWFLERAILKRYAQSWVTPLLTKLSRKRFNFKSSIGAVLEHSARLTICWSILFNDSCK